MNLLTIRYSTARAGAVLGACVARVHLVDLFLDQVGDRAAAAGECLQPLHLLEFDGGDEIPHGAAVAGDGNRLTLGNFSILAEIPGKFGSGDFTHGALTVSLAQFL